MVKGKDFKRSSLGFFEVVRAHLPRRTERNRGKCEDSGVPVEVLNEHPSPVSKRSGARSVAYLN